MSTHPYPESEAKIDIPIGIILTLLTCGLYGFYWQYKQIEALNAWLGRDELDFLSWLLLSLITCGIYGIYYEYKMAEAINEVQEKNGKPVKQDLALMCVGLALFSFGIVSLAIQQDEINRFYRD